jgi:hypothetical protein
MSYTLGQRLGRLTVTQVNRTAAEQVRCDCGTTIDTWLEFSFLAPPDEIGEYHARYLLMAEAGRLRYNRGAYPIHAVPNNAADALWRGLLLDAPGGPVLTDLGAHMLAHWKERQTGAEAATAEPPEFTAERAAWIREHAWTGAMRKEHREVPLAYQRCACQSGLTHWCQTGRHDRCHRATPQRTAAATICRRGGMEAAHFLEPYAHKTDTSATGPRFETTAMVWLADRVCRWVCPCDCGHLAPAPAEAAPAAPVQDALFAIGAPA